MFMPNQPAKCLQHRPQRKINGTITGMAGLMVRGLNLLSRLAYSAGGSRLMKVIVLVILAIVFGTIVASRSIRSEDLAIYPLPAAPLRTNVSNRYITATGRLLYNGAYVAPSPIAGFIAATMRFVPFLPVDSPEPLIVLDENLPPEVNGDTPVTIVGKYQRGDANLPDYYLKVGAPPSLLPYDIMGWVSVVLLAGVLAGGILNYLIRHVDYVITVPFMGVVSGAGSTNKNLLVEPTLLWYGSLGAAYGDVILREIPVSFRAIPAEAKLVPSNERDAWSVTIHRARLVTLTTVATSLGALPALRLEFEDERGITRDGVIAGSDRDVIDKILNVMRFVGT